MTRMMVDDDDDDDVATMSCSFLEKTIPLDVACLVMSHLSLDDLQRLSVCSRRLHNIVSYSPCIHMEDTGDQPRSNTQHYQTITTTRHQPIHCRRLVETFLDRPERLDKQSLQYLLGRYQNLRELHLAGLAPVGDSLLRLLNHAPAAPLVQSLTLKGATLTYWCPDALRFPQLKRLRITAGSIRASLALLFGQTTHLESLALEQCPTLRDDQLCKLLQPQAETLRELNVHQCMRIRRPRIELDRLERLSFMGCFALTELPRMFAPTLRDLNLSFCFRLDTTQIQGVVWHLPCLETLKLVKCPRLESLDLQSLLHLRMLNVNYCSALSWLRVNKCPAFCILENTGCLSLSTLLIQDVDSLEYLNISSLPIRRLEVTARHLRHLELQNCKYLDDCWIRSPNLVHVNVYGTSMSALRFCKAVRSALIENYWMPRTPMEMEIP